ncbi:hypothetical protein AX17_002270 [Amanita inopinata Kibby_2008]|nr:hypothetical protein AX17_002270 [Amanita inopinata Kibby_2008]
MLRRGTTPLGARAPSLETSNQAQIDDLVQRNRVLEQANKKLGDQLAFEQQHAKEAVAEIQKQWHREQKEWREGCDVLVSCHRLAHLRTIVDLENARMQVLDEEEATRQEKAQRLQRDVRISMFQIKESELEDRIVELEEEKEDIVANYEERVDQLRLKVYASLAQCKAKTEQLIAAEQERDEVQDKMVQLRQEHVTFQAGAESQATKLERVTLQLEGAQTKNTELERINDELRRTNAELRRQLEKWQCLETKGNDEMETLRKQKLDLQVRVNDLQDRMEKQVAEKDKELDKLNKRAETLDGVIQEWKDEAETERSTSNKVQKDLSRAQKRIAQLENELKAATNKAEYRASSSREKSDDDNLHGMPSSQQRTVNGKAKAARRRSRSPPEEKRVEADDRDSPEQHPKVDRTRAKSRMSPTSEIEEVTEPPGGSTKVKKGAKGAKDRGGPTEVIKNGKGKGKAILDDIEEEEEEQVADVREDQRNAPKSKRRRKASPNNHEIEVVGSKPAKGAKAKERAESETQGSRVKGQKGRQKADAGTRDNGKRSSKDIVEIADTDEGESDAVQVPTKKKRKINIFPNAPEPTFNFTTGNDLGLDIPTTLSPVAIPSRSTSASVMSRLTAKGGWRR